MLTLGTILYGKTASKRTLFWPRTDSVILVTVLLVNAVAVLSEDRFLARSTCAPLRSHTPVNAADVAESMS